MGKKKLDKQFGITNEELDARAAEYEGSDWSHMQFGKVSQGRPRISDEELDVITLRVPHSRVVAIQRIADSEGITRSDFVRQAIDNELMARA